MLLATLAYEMGSGAGHMLAPQASRTSGALLHRLAVTLILALFVEPSSAVCPHCNNFFPGCEGGDTCPLVQDLAGNIEVFKSGDLGAVPKLGHLLPANIQNLFPRRTVEILQGLWSNPLKGSADLTGEKYATARSIVQAVQFSHASKSEAQHELARRLEEAEDATEITKLSAALKMLSDISVTASEYQKGVYSFIWAKLSGHTSESGGVFKLASGIGSKASDITATLHGTHIHVDAHGVVTWLIA